ncbi:hypothetical protein BCR32DRAFT_329840 [Anaeromyces robustus]|uniref:RING-type domain-containing protein n=1 Tax=Anaeromyces robustus TaxID=1754192 RepID=A0A1Y1WP87_9FUNG|nr:hypothetical protein BCR32DRAFT_329840 [Anaeromyces robustus]|eukprot:ORX75359.1 hypothetical protein BCR32DRAFT_329840 [Anaeromyces robustus]
MSDNSSREEIQRQNKKAIKNVLKTVAGIGLATVATVGLISSIQKDKIIEEQQQTIDERDEEIDYLQKRREIAEEGNVYQGKGKELKNENGENICSVCLLGKVTKVLIPCGHYAVCSSCITKLKAYNDSRCPICRRKFEKAVMVYVN